jgi:hypothetical protein
MAEHFAQRLQHQGGDLPAQITAAYRVAFNRRPTANELRLLSACARKYGLASVCRLIFNTNEFIFID